MKLIFKTVVLAGAMIGAFLLGVEDTNRKLQDRVNLQDSVKNTALT